MRAWVIRGTGGLDQLEITDVPDPAGPLEVRPGDRVMINPGIPDYSCAYFRAGEHSLCLSYGILGEHLPGSLAPYVIVPEQNTAIIPTLPKPLTWAEAATFSLVTLTAWRMVVTRAQLRPGE